MPLITKPDKVVTYDKDDKDLPSIKPHDPLITWYFDFHFLLHSLQV